MKTFFLIVAILSQPEELSKENKFSTAEIPKKWLTTYNEIFITLNLVENKSIGSRILFYFHSVTKKQDQLENKRI